MDAAGCTLDRLIECAGVVCVRFPFRWSRAGECKHSSGSAYQNEESGAGGRRSLCGECPKQNATNHPTW
ncbi:hypothetical protein EYF80_043931 [Liparis tanakae]|uniref:Uncharacterized protein n=1 Tax=Liparis tanakae TaxID=230148 RepID=A0A4Z2FY13_9TELE|nr:hypothetical protein EYF80_043931 [Liparis tanakae]